MRAWWRSIAVVLGLAGVFGLAGGAHGGTSSVTDAAAVSASVAYLQARASDWGIRSAANEFRLRKVVRDSLGETHVRLDQVYQGVPVFGRQLVVHLDRAGTPRSATGAYLAGITASTQPLITTQDAQTAARQRFPGPLLKAPAVDLVLYPTNGSVRLAYRVVLGDDETPRRVVAFVDAANGSLIHAYNDLRTLLRAPMWPSPASATTAASEQPSASAATLTGTGNSLYSGTVSITTTQGSVGYRMVDGDRGSLRANDMQNKTFGQGMVFRDADNLWGNGATTDRASAGVDAHFGAEMTWDYYLNVHGRNGIYDDGVGSLSRVHYGTAYNNAFWSDSCQCMTYGDGDGVVFSPLTSLDVAGHEMTHGVTSATAGLIYDGESGGLNESMSDIFGTMVEFYAAAFNNDNDPPEYWIGEEVWTPGTPGDALRYMDDPTRDSNSIDHYSQYYDGIDVHYSSGISNVVFHLLAEGGAHPSSGQPVVGIGRSAAEQIFYRALTMYMVPSETFLRARADTVQAAIDLFGAGTQEVTSVNQAWTAAGVIPPPLP